MNYGSHSKLSIIVSDCRVLTCAHPEDVKYAKYSSVDTWLQELTWGELNRNTAATA